MEGFFDDYSTRVLLESHGIEVKFKNKVHWRFNWLNKICGPIEERDVPTGPREEIVTSVGRFVVQPAQRVAQRARLNQVRVLRTDLYLIHEYPEPLKSALTPNVQGIAGKSAVDATTNLYDMDGELLELGKSLAKYARVEKQ